MFISLEKFWIYIFITVSIFSVLIGSFTGLLQHKIKRMLAYSSITNVGFFMAPLCSQTVEGFSFSFLYFLIYSILSLGLFSMIIDLRYFNNLFKFKNVFEYSTLLNSNFLSGYFLILFLFSLTGIPPLSGFFGKFFILTTTVFSGSTMLFMFLMLSSVVSGYYYLRSTRLILFKHFIGFVFIKPFLEYTSLILVLTSLFNLLLFLDSSTIFFLLHNIMGNSFFISVFFMNI